MRRSVPILTVLLALFVLPAAAQLQQSAYGFLSLSGRNEKANAIISWETIQELTITHFNVQQSTDGQHFTNIATLSARHDSDETNHSYRFVDAGAALRAKRVYYRLEIAVNNGRMLYSKTMLVRFDASGDERINLYPNFVRTTLPLAVESHYEGAARIQVLDLSGRVLLTENIRMEPGTWFRNLDVSRLATGHYVIAILGDGLRMQERFFRQ